MSPLSVTLDPTASVTALAEFLRDRAAVVLTGAGCSTESGIPDYRGPDGRLHKRGPMTFQEFTSSDGARARYWSRSMIGWPRFSSALPNRAHRALSRLEAIGAVRGVITQNVDGLHQAAGSTSILELHGSLARVRCLECGSLERRVEILEAMNPGFASSAEHYVADGDAELPKAASEGFRVAGCRWCGGVLKPDVVFFGESVPKERLERTWRLYSDGEVLLVVGSSLTVFSGRRFVLRAVQEGKPVAIVNLGPTRGDECAALKVEAQVGQVLPAVVGAMSR